MSSSSQSKHPETLALHAGWRADPATGAVAVPIYQTTSYQFRDTEHAANLFALQASATSTRASWIRLTTCWRSAWRQWKAASPDWRWHRGRPPPRFALQNLARVGDNVVSSTDLYGGTWNLFAEHADGSRHPKSASSIRSIRKTFVAPPTIAPAYYAETLTQPEAYGVSYCRGRPIGRSFGVPLIMDNTAAPVLTLPLITARRWSFIPRPNIWRARQLDRRPHRRWRQFHWEAHAQRQPALNTPDPSYHGAVWTQAVKPLGPIAYIIKARVTLLRDIGSAMSPFNAFLIGKGVETVTLRMAKHCENAGGDRSAKRPEITRVIHPSVQRRAP